MEDKFRIGNVPESRADGALPLAKQFFAVLRTHQRHLRQLTLTKLGSMAKDNSKKLSEALAFSSSLLPNPEETKHLRDNLRANYLPREATRLRATVASSPTELMLYSEHIVTLTVAQSTHLPEILLSSSETSPVPAPFPSMELVTIDAALKRIQTERDTLSEYAAICSSALSPIRRLPPEVLLQVFLLCAPVPNIQWELNSKDYAAELNRLTRRDLLQLSQVCAHWRALALGTPVFWRAVDLDMMFWSHKMLPLVQLVLERSGSSPLQIRLGAPEDVVVDRSVLELIAQHSSRWQTALFSMDFSFYTSLSAVQGNLPLLEGINISGPVDVLEHSPAAVERMATAAVQLISVAPRLVDVTFAGPAKALERLPWSQLKRFEYLDVQWSELTDALSVLRHFPPGMQFELRRLVVPPRHEGLHFTSPPVVSDLTDLVIEFALHSPSGVADVLNRLTLPALTFLDVASLFYPSTPIPWDRPAFQQFCARSRCSATLTTLYLLHVALTPADLLASLAELPALMVLVVADHCATPGIPEHVLLTDEIFRRLSWDTDSSAPRLVPRLAVFGCLALLRFDEAVYLDFVSSRVRVRQDKEFESHIRWQPGSSREIKPAILDELQRLLDKGLVGSIEAANEIEMQTFFY